MNIVEELEHIAEEELCAECHAVLTEEEMEQGFVCLSCIHNWINEVSHEHQI